MGTYYTMGIDLDHRRKNKPKKGTNSENLYLGLLIKLYKFLARRTGANFNAVVLKRLQMTKINRPPVSLSKLLVLSKTKSVEDDIFVVVGKVLNDSRALVKLPPMKVCALQFSEQARARIVAAGGECFTFDQLAEMRPTGSRCVLVRGPRKARKAESYFGRAPGVPGSHTKQYITSNSKKAEVARGKRNSRVI